MSPFLCQPLFQILLLNSSSHCHSRDIGSHIFNNLRISSIAIAESFFHNRISLLLGSFRISSSALSLLTLLISFLDSVFNSVEGDIKVEGNLTIAHMRLV